jgi:hypothetical protein
MSTFEEEQEQVVYENKLRSEIEVKQMLRDAIDLNPEGTVWHVNTEYIYEQGEVKSKEDQKKADEAAWSDARNACAAVRDAALDAAGENAALVTAAYSNYTAACLAIDDHWDAVRAKREAWGV